MHPTTSPPVGLTATPKETKYVSNIAYFGEPVFSYSLKEGIRDGFLAPYKVVKVHIDRDVEGYRPEKGQLDRDGEEVEDRIYNTKDFDRTLVIDGRTKLVAQKVTQFLKESGDRFQKAIVFCVDREHAARMRQALINENVDLVDGNPRYVIRITGGDAEGQDELNPSARNRVQRFPFRVALASVLGEERAGIVAASVAARAARRAGVPEAGEEEPRQDRLLRGGRQLRPPARSVRWAARKERNGDRGSRRRQETDCSGGPSGEPAGGAAGARDRSRRPEELRTGMRDSRCTRLLAIRRSPHRGWSALGTAHSLSNGVRDPSSLSSTAPEWMLLG